MVIQTEEYECTSFEELAQLCQSMSHDIPRLELTSFSNRSLNCDPVDEYADAWLPVDCRIRSPVPIRTKPDGSCFAQAASRLIFGTPNRHVEVRVRLILEGVKNREYYTNHDELAFGISFPLTVDLSSYYCEMTGDSNELNTVRDVPLLYADILNYTKESSYASMWQVHQLAGVVKMPVMCVYPILPSHEHDNQLFRNFRMHRAIYNRIICPVGPDVTPVLDTFNMAIMWTVTGNTYRSRPHASINLNHFVPLVP